MKKAYCSGFFSLTVALTSVVFGLLPARAGLWFNCPGAEGNWTDVNNWYTWYYYRAQDKATSIYSTTDVNMELVRTAVVNTDITKSLYAYWSIAMGSDLGSNGKYATLRIENGGKLVGSTQTGKVQVGKKLNNRAGYGLIDVQPGGEFGGWLHIGVDGFGIVTNAGTIALSDMHLGVNGGAKGTYVLDGGTVTLPNPKDIFVGENGVGELLVNSGTFGWKWYVDEKQKIGYQHIGCGTEGTGKGTVVVEDGATFQNAIAYYGGNATLCGDGLLRMRGGTYNSLATDGQQGLDTLWIGAGQDATGAVRSGSHGEIRGWGKFTCYEDNAKPKAICGRLGNGAIIADGEGVERTLDCSAMWQVTNVLFCAESDRTNGWYAVNKGAVVLPGVNLALDATGGDNWGCSSGSNSVGCCRALVKPDLINAVQIDVGVPWKAAGKNLGVMLLASDRSDAHADKLNAKYAPLGFWKAGVFDDRTVFSEAKSQNINRAKIDFRYDHHKIQDAANQLAIFRWSETNQKWDRVVSYKMQPSDYIVSTGMLTTGFDNPVFKIGLYCVAEKIVTPGSVLILR